MAGLWSVRKCGARYGPSRRAPAHVAVRPAVRSSPAIGGAVPWVVRGSARCTGSSGLGDTAAYIPAGGGSGPGGAFRLPDRRGFARARACTERCGSLRERPPTRATATGFGRKSTLGSVRDNASHHGNRGRTRRSGGAYGGAFTSQTPGCAPAHRSVPTSSHRRIPPIASGVASVCGAFFVAAW